MRVVSGRDASLYLPSAALRFAGEPMQDVGDGFDWRISDRSKQLWLGDELVFTVDGEPELPLDVELHTGRASFARCLRGRSVSVSGVCLPLARVASAEHWQLRLQFSFADATAMRGDQMTAGKRVGGRAVLSGWVLDHFYLPALHDERVVLRMPFSTGVICAAGAVTPESLEVAADRRGDPLHVHLEEELRYAPH